MIDFINLCQIWDWQLLNRQKSFSVPAYIIQRGNQYLPTININEGSLLSAVYYINRNDECLVLRYKSLCGLLMLKNDDNAIQNSLHPFPSFLGHINDANISSNQQLISVTTEGVS